MTLTPLDSEYQITVPVDDSPMFHNLVQHWGGIPETVVDVEQHYYQEVIHLTEVRHTVVTINAKSVGMVESIAKLEPPRYNVEDVVFTGSVDIPLFDDKRIDDTMTNWDAWFKEEQARRPRWRRTRLFFKMVWIAWKTARESK
jgi:hypothetical protein